MSESKSMLARSENIETQYVPLNIKDQRQRFVGVRITTWEDIFVGFVQQPGQPYYAYNTRAPGRYFALEIRDTRNKVPYGPKPEKLYFNTTDERTATIATYIDNARQRAEKALARQMRHADPKKGLKASAAEFVVLLDAKLSPQSRTALVVKAKLEDAGNHNTIMTITCHRPGTDKVEQLFGIEGFESDENWTVEQVKIYHDVCNLNLANPLGEISTSPRLLAARLASYINKVAKKSPWATEHLP